MQKVVQSSCCSVIIAIKRVTRFCYPLDEGLKLCSCFRCHTPTGDDGKKSIYIHTHAAALLLARETKKCQLASLKQLCSYFCCYSSLHNQFLTVEFKIKDFFNAVCASRKVNWCILKTNYGHRWFTASRALSLVGCRREDSFENFNEFLLFENNNRLLL